MNDRIQWKGIDLLLRFCAYIHNKYDIPFNYVYTIFEKYTYFLEYYIQMDDEKTWEDEWLIVTMENENEDAFDFISEWVIYLNNKGINPYKLKK